MAFWNWDSNLFHMKFESSSWMLNTFMKTLNSLISKHIKRVLVLSKSIRDQPWFNTLISDYHRWMISKLSKSLYFPLSILTIQTSSLNLKNPNLKHHSFLIFFSYCNLPSRMCLAFRGFMEFKILKGLKFGFLWLGF